jgi:hypothetical protein
MARKASSKLAAADLGFVVDIGKDHADSFPRDLIEADLVDTVLHDSADPQNEAHLVAILDLFFYSTPSLVCVWLLTKNKAADAGPGFRDRTQLTLLIDARNLRPLSLSAKKVSIPSHHYLSNDTGIQYQPTFHYHCSCK